MKKQLFIAIFFGLTAQVSLADSPKVIKLTNPMLKLIDGMPMGVDCETVSLIRKLQSKLYLILRGKKSPDGSFAGKYKLNDQNLSLNELVKIELDTITKIPSTKEYEERLKKLQKALSIAKEDFRECTEPFLHKIQQTKKYVVELIVESCEKRNLKESLLLGWAETEDEAVYFEKSIKDFQTFKTFTDDLINFLNDLLYSCEDGWSQYMEWINELKKNRQN